MQFKIQFKQVSELLWHPSYSCVYYFKDHVHVCLFTCISGGSRGVDFVNGEGRTS